MDKIYLSAAAHFNDNPTKCPVKCSENKHCIEYMDIVERLLKYNGFDVRRGYVGEVGESATKHRVADANKWDADLYYVAHTNAGGGRYTMTMCWDDAESKKKAEAIGKYRKSVTPHKVVARNDLYEINSTNMTCLYDELFFHDNAEDCSWFHNGGMEIMAEETVQALCEIFGVKYKSANADDKKLKELESKVEKLQAEVASLKNTVSALTVKIENAKKALQ